MPISKELFLAILSLDSYNRGYNSGLSVPGGAIRTGLGGVGSKIGSATVTNEDNSAAAEGVGFYAVAYNTPYGKVISYRGTDNWGSLPNVTDIFYGYGLGAGSPYGEQARMAASYLAPPVPLSPRIR